jgi:hypothetical protein
VSASSESTERPRRASGKSGKPYKAHRLGDLDLRTEAGRLYCRHFEAFATEFPDASPSTLRDLAMLAATGEQVSAESLGAPDPWLRARARQDALRVSALLHRKLAVLRDQKAPTLGPSSSAAEIAASIRAKREARNA